jgi:hypothetical protein
LNERKKRELLSISSVVKKLPIDQLLFAEFGAAWLMNAKPFVWV